MGLTPRQLRDKHTESFRAFWKAYPKHQAEQAAWTTWANMVEYENLDPITTIQAARNMAKQLGGDLTYCQFAHNWLKEGRFTDVDLFTDEVNSERDWVMGCYDRCDVAAVENRFQEKMPRINAPDGVEDVKVIAAHYKAKAREWIMSMADREEDE